MINDIMFVEGSLKKVPNEEQLKQLKNGTLMIDDLKLADTIIEFENTKMLPIQLVDKENENSKINKMDKKPILYATEKYINMLLEIEYELGYDYPIKLMASEKRKGNNIIYNIECIML